MKSILTVRAKRLAIVLLVRLRRFGLKALPFGIVLWAGIEWGTMLEDARIHNDCKFTNTFRINYTGYTCRIGRE